MSRTPPAPLAGTPAALAAEAEYEAAKQRLRDALAQLPAHSAVRLAKRTSSNLFRARSAGPDTRLDVSDLHGVLRLDLSDGGRGDAPVGTSAGTADVLGMTTYEELVDALLPHGVMPRVVPQLKTITLGGAVTGLGIESSSFRNGCPHESVRELDVLTGDGRIVTARPDNEHSDLFFGFPNSYGSLGYALRLRIEVEPVRPYVHLRHVRFGSAPELLDALGTACARREFRGEPVDFVDGVMFSPGELYLTVAAFAADAPATSDYTGNDIYYQSIRRRAEDYLTIRDYLWRWDTDWFWCSRAFGVQHPAVRRLVPKRYLRSDTYWKIVALEKRYGVYRRWESWRGKPEREDVIQDVEIPVERTAEFLDFFAREVGIAPVWLCPLQQRDPGVRWDLYPLDPAELYVNVGFWSSVALPAGVSPDAGLHNRRIEQVVGELGGRKSLYSTSYYEPDRFWELYGGESYRLLKKRYDAGGRLLDLYAKCVQAR